MRVIGGKGKMLNIRERCGGCIEDLWVSIYVPIVWDGKDSTAK